MKKQIYLAIIILGLANIAMAQTPCNIINSATFSAPYDSVITQKIDIVAVPSSQFPINTNEWTHIAMTKGTNNDCKYYKNGVLVGVGTYANLSYSWSRLDLGAVFYTSYNGFFKGWLDEVRVSNKVRTAKEISDSYNAQSEFSADANVVGLWHFNETSGTSVSAVRGSTGALTNATFANGKFSNGVYFNGTNAYARMNTAVPNSNMTIEFWVKTDGLISSSWFVSFYGMNTAGLGINSSKSPVSYLWSNGSTAHEITVNPAALPYVWVSNGNCRDTIFFDRYNNNSDSLKLVIANDSIAKLNILYANKHDTLYVGSNITTDTLKISIRTGLANSSLVLNSLKVYPNPAATLLNIELEKPGYFIAKLSSVTGQTIITPTSGTIDISNLSNGVYILTVYDSNNKLISTNKVLIVK